MKTIKLSNLIDGYVDFLDVRSSVFSSCILIKMSLGWAQHFYMSTEVPELKVLLRVQLLLLSYYMSGPHFFFLQKAPSTFLLSSGRKRACVESGGCAHPGHFLEDAKCSPQL